MNLPKSIRLAVMVGLVGLAVAIGWSWLNVRTSQLIFTTGSHSGLYHLLAEQLVMNIAGEDLGATFDLLPSSGSSQNIARLQSGQANLAIVQNDSIGDDSVRSIAGLYPEVLHLVCRSESKIRSLRDLQGLRVCVGEQGSGTENVAKSLLEFARIKVAEDDAAQVSFDAAKVLLRENELDAAFFLVGVGSPIIEDLLSDDRMSLVPLQVETSNDEIPGADARDFIDGFRHHYPYVSSYAIPMMVYEGRPSRPVPSLSVQAVLVCRTDLDFKIAERITRMLFDKRALLAQHAQPISYLDEGRAQADLQFPLHPGAESFYRRREPGFLAQNAESMAFVLTVGLLGLSTLGWIFRVYSQSRKNRVDGFYEEINALRHRLQGCANLQDFDALAQDLRDVDLRASTELVNEQLDANDSYLIYQNMYASCELAIATAQAALRKD